MDGLKAQDIMTPDPICCGPDTPLYVVAHLMAEHDCGAIPVVQSPESHRLMGIVTDRDIACRMVARRKSAEDEFARDCMSSPVIKITPEASVEECCRTMIQYRVRRLVVSDMRHKCCGIIALADIASHVPAAEAAAVLRAVSQAPQSASRYHTSRPRW